jgi:peptide/nickel transport system substrate-binding protein/microcin C transport system substrate-binding protein
MFMGAFSDAAPAAKGSVYARLPVPKKGGVFYDVTKINPVTLNPLIEKNLEDRELISYLFMPLMSRDPDTYDRIPALAEKVESTKDNKEHVFTLRKDAKWTDGTPVTADDVVFTFQKTMDPKVEAAAQRSFLSGVSIEKVDTLRVKFKVETPKFNSLDFIASLTPIQKKQFENESDFNKSREGLRPIGNTGYKFKSASRDQNVIFEYVPGWWGEKDPEYRATHNFETIHFRVIPDDTLAYERMLKGEIDTMTISADKFATQVRGVDKERVGTQANSGKTIWADQFKSNGSLPWFGMALNYKNPIFTQKTRQAIAHLVDYETVIQKAFFGLTQKCLTPFGSNGPNLDPKRKSSEKQYKFDAEVAMTLLKADGWADTDGDNILDKKIDGKTVPFKFEFKYSAANGPANSTAQILKESFKKAGIQMSLRPSEGAALYKDFEEKNFDATFMGWGGGSIFPDPRQIWHSSSAQGNGSNSVSYSNPKVDALIDQANLEFDRKKRAKMLQEIGNILYEDLPYIFLVERKFVLQLIHSRIQSPKWIFNFGTSVAKDLFYQ